MRVTVVGAGLMGSQIGVEYALGGHEVRFLVRNGARAQARIDAALALLVTHGLRTEDEVARARELIEAATEPRRAAVHAQLVVESLPEELGLKAEVLSTVRRHAAPDAVMATNTSSLSITALGEAIGAPERTVGTHYLNPPLLMPPVEIVAGERTSAATLDLAKETLAALGKAPILVGRDVPGFVWNRLQFALVRECAWLVERGVATREDVDTVVREGLARRWRHVGPLRSIALGGVETWNRAAANIVPELSTAAQLGDLGEVAIAGGDLGSDADRRDAELARELRNAQARTAASPSRRAPSSSHVSNE